MTPALLTVLSALLGCYSEADFAEAFWEAQCEQVLTCYDDASRELLQYEDTAGCLAHNADSIEATRAQVEAEDCTYDAQQAQVCVDELAGASCEDFLAASYSASCEVVCEP